MRFVIFGVGAIGGTFAVKLARAGTEVVGIARGRQLAALKENGLTIETPDGDEHARFPVVAHASEIQFRPDDVILLTVKGQDTMAALSDLRAAGVGGQAIVCAQNGVDNERMALRIFPNVYGMCVRMPTNFERFGVIRSWGSPHAGNFDIGRFPKGADATSDAIAAALVAAGFLAESHPNVMVTKYEKLLANLSNALQAAFGRTPPAQHYYPYLRREGEAVLAAAGISVVDETQAGKPSKVMSEHPVKGEKRPGTSTWQSLMRGTGSTESDLLNGEIALLGRLHGVPTPANDYFCRLAQRMAEEGMAPGSADPDAVAREFAEAMKAAGQPVEPA